jgi:hypothetical protein
MTDKITFTSNGESHELPIDGSKTLRPGNVSPDMKLTVTGSFSPPLKIVLMPQASGGPIMTIHPDGRITLGENEQPTEAAAECIDAMSHMIESMVRKAAADERAAIVAWMKREEEGYPFSEYSGFVAMIREEVEAGEHLK